MLIGTLCKVSERFCAVTMMSPLSCPEVGSIGTLCASAGVTANVDDSSAVTTHARWRLGVGITELYITSPFLISDNPAPASDSFIKKMFYVRILT